MQSAYQSCNLQTLTAEQTFSFAQFLIIISILRPMLSLISVDRLSWSGPLSIERQPAAWLKLLTEPEHARRQRVSCATVNFLVVIFDDDHLTSY
jgi:hypothetical protein